MDKLLFPSQKKSMLLWIISIGILELILDVLGMTCAWKLEN